MKSFLFAAVALLYFATNTSASNWHEVQEIGLCKSVITWGSIVFFATAIISGFLVMKSIGKIRDDDRNKSNVTSSSIYICVLTAVIACSLPSSNDFMGVIFVMLGGTIIGCGIYYALSFAGIASSIGWFVGISIMTNQLQSLITTVAFALMAIGVSIYRENGLHFSFKKI